MAQKKTATKRSLKPKGVKGLVHAQGTKAHFINITRLPSQAEVAALMMKHPDIIKGMEVLTPESGGLDGIDIPREPKHATIRLTFANAIACEDVMGAMFNDGSEAPYAPFADAMPDDTNWVLPGMDALAEKVVKG